MIGVWIVTARQVGIVSPRIPIRRRVDWLRRRLPGEPDQPVKHRDVEHRIGRDSYRAAKTPDAGQRLRRAVPPTPSGSLFARPWPAFPLRRTACGRMLRRASGEFVMNSAGAPGRAQLPQVRAAPLFTSRPSDQISISSGRGDKSRSLFKKCHNSNKIRSLPLPDVEAFMS
jgi:hypothetical protein